MQLSLYIDMYFNCMFLAIYLVINIAVEVTIASNEDYWGVGGGLGDAIILLLFNLQKHRSISTIQIITMSCYTFLFK